MALEFNKCCLYFNLRTGCLIIGYLNLIVDVTFILICIVGILANQYMIKQPDAKEDVKDFGPIMFATLAISVVLLLLFLAFIIVLLIGLHQNKRDHVKAYMIFLTVFLVLYISTFIFVAYTSDITAYTILRDFTCINLSIYFLLVLRSHYLKMDDPANKPEATVYYAP